jgi:Flp pilus assembly protein TadG
MMRMGQRARGALSRFRREDAGAGTVEFALTGSALITLVVGILWLGWVLQIRNDLAQAADRGVRYVVMNPNATDQAVQAEVTALLVGYSTPNLTVRADSQTVGTTSFRRVRVSYVIPVTIPGVSSPITLNVSRRTPTL